MAHYAQATDLLLGLVPVRNDPVAANDLRRALASIGDADFVSKDELLFGRIRLVRYEMRLDRHRKFKRFHMHIQRKLQ